MSVKVLVIVACVLIASGVDSEKLTKGQKYIIQNAGDNTILTVLTEGGVCNPVLGQVITETKGPNDNENSNKIWTSNWWGESSAQFGIHFENDKIFTTMTFQHFPPHCYPVYHSWDLLETGYDAADVVLIKSREADRCLASAGNGNVVHLEICNAAARTQRWRFQKVLSDF